MADNVSLASRIDQEVEDARQQVSRLRDELQLVKDIANCKFPSTVEGISSAMAGNVITTCMPPTATTTTTTAVSSECQWLKESKAAHQAVESTPRTTKSSASLPPLVDKGGTHDLLKKHVYDQKQQATPNGQHKSADEEDRSALSPKKTVFVKETVIYEKQDVKSKSDSLIENVETSDKSTASKQRHNRHERSLKGSDVQLSLMNDLKIHQSNSTLDDSKSDLQRSESDGNQNSAPECDLSISGSPFKEDCAKLDLDDSLLGDSPRRTSYHSKSCNVDSSKDDDVNMELHRSSPPVKDVPSAQCYPLPKDSSSSHKENVNSHRHKTKSDPLDQRREKTSTEFSVLSSPSSVMKHKVGITSVPIGTWDDYKKPSTSWYKTPDNSSSGKSLLDESSSKDETSDSQDGPPTELCDRHPTKDSPQGRHIVFDSTKVRKSRLECTNVVRDQNISKSSKRVSCDIDCDETSNIEKPGKNDRDDEGETVAAAEVPCSEKPNTELLSLKSGQEEGPLDALRIRNSALLRDLEEVMSSRDDKARENALLLSKLERTDKELKGAKEALAALKQDRKRLKAEKLDLLTQMKQLYSTLEDKEAELRQFIRSYTQKVRDGDVALKQLQAEREALEREKWALLQRARDEAERSVLLCTQLGLKDARIADLQRQLQAALQDKQSTGPETRPRNGYGSPGSMSYRTTNGVDSHGTVTPTLGSSDPPTSPSYAGTPIAHYAESASPRKIPVSPEGSRPGLLSRSAEELFSPTPRRKKGGTWGSISRVFSRARKRKPLRPDLFQGQRSSWSPSEGLYANSEADYAEQVRLLEESKGVPMQHWRAGTVFAWLRLAMDMPQYASACADNVRSGKLLLELSDSELEEGLGIVNSMHRRKLRLAIEEYRQPSLCRYPKICLMSHSWVLEEFLPSIALSCYMPSFAEHLIDGRVLDTLTKRDLEKHFGISRKFHQLSIMHAVQLLRMLNFDRQILEQRRATSEAADLDPLVWSNARLQRWAGAVELGEYAENLKNTGVHGALAVLEPSFTADTMATALGIPPSKNILRRHLTTEWNNLIQPARLSLESENAVCRRSEKRAALSSGGSSASLASQGATYARRTLDRNDRRRSSWRFSTWKSSQESLRSLTSRSKAPPAERPQVLPLSPKLSGPRHRRTFSSHSDVTETLTVTPV